MKITLDVSRLYLYLTPGDQRRTDIEWIGTITRGYDIGALGRIKYTGTYVQVNAGSTRTLDQRKVNAMMLEASKFKADKS